MLWKANKQTKQIRSFVCWENLRRANLILVLSDLYNSKYFFQVKTYRGLYAIFLNLQFEIWFLVFWQSYNFLFQVSSVAPVTYALVEAHYQARPTYSASSNPPMSRPQQNDMRVSYTYGQPPTSCYSYGGNKNISIKLFRKIRNGVLFQKFVWPTERKKMFLG